ncbi:MAG: hypothetical protein ACPG5T_01110 [Endozoicomonas sp.]
MAEPSSNIRLDYPDQQIGSFRFVGEDITRPWLEGELVRITGKEAAVQTITGQRWFTDEKTAQNESSSMDEKVESICNLQFFRGPYGNQKQFNEKKIRLKDVKSTIPVKVVINGLVTVYMVKYNLTVKRLA